MQYIDVSRFISSIEDAPGLSNSLVLEETVYTITGTGYRTDITSSKTVSTVDWDSIWWVNLRIGEYSFAIDQQWRDLERVLHNNQPAIWISVSNLTGVDIMQKLFEKLKPTADKRLYIEIHNTLLPHVSVNYDVDISVVPEGFELVDIHHSIDHKTTRFIPAVPQQESADYTPKLLDQIV